MQTMQTSLRLKPCLKFLKLFEPPLFPDRYLGGWAGTLYVVSESSHIQIVKVLQYTVYLLSKTSPPPPPLHAVYIWEQGDTALNCRK
jgi:hypothetical protein